MRQSMSPDLAGLTEVLAESIPLGGLARDHGEKLLRVKGVVEFADRPVGPAAIHAVQHTLYPPRWLERWPDTDHVSRLVFRRTRSRAGRDPPEVRGRRTHVHHPFNRSILMLDLAITGGTCVLPTGTQAADISVKDGRIVLVGGAGTLPQAPRTVSAGGRLVIPGGI